MFGVASLHNFCSGPGAWGLSDNLASPNVDTAVTTTGSMLLEQS